MNTDPRRLTDLNEALARYGELTGGGRNPVYRVLAGAVRAGAWGIGAAQCRSVLQDAFSLRMMETDEEEGAVRELGRVFESLRTAAGQLLARWNPEGYWEMPEQEKGVLGRVLLGAWCFTWGSSR